MTFPVVDIFAGPGGLGEGFSAYRKSGKPAFKIAVSAEMEKNAAATLRLRAFFRQFADGEVPQSYYDYVSGSAPLPWTAETQLQWEAAGNEALQLTLGEPQHDAILDARIKRVAECGRPWILIGGPPCQAYSLVGRSRNAGIPGYRAEEDSRHFLYRHYLEIIRRHQPTAFIMENVKGILSSKVGGESIFSRILTDLRGPHGRNGKRYRLIPLVDGHLLPELDVYEPEQYVLRSELLGIPQARHRVILFGLDKDIPFPKRFLRSDDTPRHTVRSVIGGMPRVRSGITTDENNDWQKTARRLLRDVARQVTRTHPEVAYRLSQAAIAIADADDPGTGGTRVKRDGRTDRGIPESLKDWLIDRRLRVHLNHEARSHMQSDLQRYAFAAAFAEVHSRSPRGHVDFPAALAPGHNNWESGKFVDRFKVQGWDMPSSTVTSHLAKDGHYFIHPDAAQLRSLTVREAARLQTFPDNYFFEGARGAQYRQVGNAVPPLLARQIADIVHAALSR